MFAKILPALLIASLALSFISLTLSDKWWIFDVLAHGHGQILVFTLLLSVTVIFLGKTGFGIAGIIYSFGIFLLIMTPLRFGSDTVTGADLFFMNTLYFNTNNEMIADYIKQANPTIIALVEPHEYLIDSLSESFGPTILVNPDANNSLAVWTKRTDVIDTKIIGNARPFGIIEFSDHILFVVHPHPPMKPEWARSQRESFREISDLKDQYLDEGKKVVIAGDFNASAFGKPFRQHFGDLHTENRYTWSTNRPWSISIDHILSSEEITVTKTPRLSSDHDGLFANYSFQK